MPPVPATTKPRYKVKAFGRATTGPTRDSFVNFMAGLGTGADNLFSGGGYAFNYTTRNRGQLDAMYRGSWLVRQAVDIRAVDMTRAGADFVCPDLKPQEVEAMQAAIRDMQIWQGLANNIRWARLYGGSIAVMMIDGQRLDTPLNLKSITKDSFKGLVVMDRWLVEPSLTGDGLVREMGPDFGLPKFYRVVGDTGVLNNMLIHYSRVLRMEGAPLPYYQKWAEMLWGSSCIEPVLDRIVAYDSTSQGAAQLVFKAHLRTLKIPKLRELIAAGGPLMEAVQANLDAIRRMQTTEGLTVLDGEDDFETHTYTFAGLDKLMDKFGDQICGALETPAARLFGQSPGGLNTDGESHLATYYERINGEQEMNLRRPCTVLFDVMGRSVLGRELPKGFTFNFRALSEMDEVKKTTVAKDRVATVVQAYESGLVSQRAAMMELRALSEITGMFTNITDEDIEAAEDSIPTMGDLADMSKPDPSDLEGTGGPASEGQGGDKKVTAIKPKKEAA